MILNTTLYHKEHKPMINGLVGAPFSFWKKLKMRGVGSGRMMIEQVSPNMQQFLNQVSDITYASLEIRPNGILLRIAKGHQNFTWIIPYYQLVIYKSPTFSIHAQGRFVKFTPNKLYRENLAFFAKILQAKSNFNH